MTGHIRAIAGVSALDLPAVLTASSSRTLLLLLLLAACHASASALVRPLYQVSDEVNYFASVQRVALVNTPDAATTACIGSPSPLIAGGRRVFHETGAALLIGACRLGAGAGAPIVVRLVLGLTLVLSTWCGWEAARLVSRSPVAPALTALVIATQPVLAKYAGAITPDSLVNASAAVAIVATLGLLTQGPSTGRLVVAAFSTVLAMAFKENGAFLPVVHALVLAVWSLGGARRRAWMRLAVLCLGGVGLAWVLRVMPTTYAVGPGVRRALAAPVAYIGLVVADTLTRLPVFFGSAYSSLGGFGGTSAPLPSTAAVVALTIWATGVTGLALAWRESSTPARRVMVYLSGLAVACLLQAPTRQVLLGMTDQHQGRWLFPVAVPVALALATGLARVGGPRGWALLVLAHLTMMGTSLAAVIQYHVTSPGWVLDRAHLYLHSTGGLDIGVARTADQVTRAWAATSPPVPAMLALLSCLACGALLLARRPVPGPTHVHHADHR